MPVPCRTVFPDPDSTSPQMHVTWTQHDQVLMAKMQQCGIDRGTIENVQNRAAVSDLDSHRKVKKNVQAGPLPHGFIEFFAALETYQAIEPRECNVAFENVSRGCGYPSPTPNACRAGWNGREILMFRSFAWNTELPKPWYQAGRAMCDALRVTYTVNPSFPTPDDVRTTMHIPVTAQLKRMLAELPPGPPMSAQGGFPLAPAHAMRHPPLPGNVQPPGRVPGFDGADDMPFPAPAPVDAALASSGLDESREDSTVAEIGAGGATTFEARVRAQLEEGSAGECVVSMPNHLRP